jgi:hypothetical protein
MPAGEFETGICVEDGRDGAADPKTQVSPRKPCWRSPCGRTGGRARTERPAMRGADLVRALTEHRTDETPSAEFIAGQALGTCAGVPAVQHDLPPRTFVRFVAPPALAPGLQRCCTNPPRACVLRFVAPPPLAPGLPWGSTDPPQRALFGFVAPPALAPGLQPCSTNPPPSALFAFVAPPGLARGLHHCSAPHNAAHQQAAMNSVRRND